MKYVIAILVPGILLFATVLFRPCRSEPGDTPPAEAKDPEGGIRLAQYVEGDTQEFFTYGLKVVPPWPDGGHLRINFPEHLESMPGTRGILRWSDATRFGEKAKGRWVVAADGMSAVLDAPSAEQPGVFVRGEAKVVSKNRVEVSMRITNKTARRTLGAIRPLYCHHYQPLNGFPRWQHNLEHTFVLMDGKRVSLSEVKTEKDGLVKGGSVRGCPQQNDSEFVVRHGGLIDAGLDRAIVVVTSLDGKRALVMGWTPGKSCMSNAAIPCVHADPYYGDIAPGESKVAREVLILTEDDPDTVVKQLIAEGLGAPPKEE